MATTKIIIDDRSLRRLEKSFQKAPRLTQALVSKGLDAVGAIAAKNTLKNDPVPYQFGFLLASFRYEKISPLVSRWFPTVKYAGYVDQGTKYMRPRKFMDKIAQKSDPEVQKLFNSLALKIASQILK